MNWKAARSLTFAACLLTICAGCSVSGEPPIARVLPPEPDFARPVIVADPKAGEGAVAVAARERAGRVAANARIVAFREWYRGVAAKYAKN